MRACEQNVKKRHVSIDQKLGPFEQNPCDFLIQRIRFVLNQQKKFVVDQCNSFKHQSFAFTQLNIFEYSKLINSSISPIDGTWTSTTYPTQSGFWSHGNECVIYIPQNSKIASSPSDLVSEQDILSYGVCPSAKVKILQPQLTGLASC